MIMEKLEIDPEFEDLIPPLTPEEYQGLEQNLLENGCLDSLKVWQGILCDGHNRYTICQKHHLPFTTENLHFDTRTDAKIWIIKNQFDRRNLPLYERSRLALQLEPLFQEQALKKKQLAGKLYGEKHPKSQEVSQNSVKALDTQKEVAKAAGVSHDTIAKVKKIEEKADEATKAKLRTGQTSINEAYKQVKREEQKEHRRQIAMVLETPSTQSFTDFQQLKKQYRIVYADPPWFYKNDPTQAMPGSTTSIDHYPSMKTIEICTLPVKMITLDDSVLFLWTTTAHLQEAFTVIDAWGFQYKTNLVWNKVKHNYGPYLSVRHEHLLLATKGSCTPEKSGSEKSIVTIERTKHSEKPEQFREMIDRLYPFGNRIELFARNITKNTIWDFWGNQL